MRIVICHEFGSKSQLVSQVTQIKQKNAQLWLAFGIVLAMKLGQIISCTDYIYRLA